MIINILDSVVPDDNIDSSDSWIEDAVGTSDTHIDLAHTVVHTPDSN